MMMLVTKADMRVQMMMIKVTMLIMIEITKTYADDDAGMVGGLECADVDSDCNENDDSDQESDEDGE